MKITEQEKTCFVISPIGSVGSDVRKRSDQVFKHVISKAVVPLGYKPIRADQIPEPGIITTQVIQQTIDAPLVIADLSTQNPNVFYELAVRHMTRKPLIMLITAGEKIPFDVSASRVIQYDLGDLDTLDRARDEIIEQSKSMSTGKQLDNPISNSLELKSLKSSADPEQRTIADIMEILQSMMGEIKSMRNSATDAERHALAYSATSTRDLGEKAILALEVATTRRQLVDVTRVIEGMRRDPRSARDAKELARLENLADNFRHKLATLDLTAEELEKS